MRRVSTVSSVVARASFHAYISHDVHVLTHTWLLQARLTGVLVLQALA